MRKWFRENKHIEKLMDDLLHDIYKEFGWKTRLFAPIAGRYLYMGLKKEDKRLAEGWSYEPRTFYEKNAAALALENTGKPSDIRSKVKELQWVSCKPVAPVLSKS